MARPYGLIFLGATAFGFALWAQDDAPLKARELFYKPLNATPAAVPSTGKKTSPKKAAVKPPGKETAVEARNPEMRIPSSGGAVLMPAAYAPQPLGLKYTIVKQVGPRYREVDPDSEFRTGDHIRVNVEANDSAYLYIVMQGSSGKWQLLFPHPEISGGNNRIERGKVYGIPPADLPAFYFDEQPGTEKVTLILTRTPEPDLEKLIYSAGERNKPAAASKTMLAQNTPISNEVMGQVQRQMLSRDLVFEKTQGPASDDQAEKAMYVATPDTSAGARLYVDLKLAHK